MVFCCFGCALQGDLWSLFSNTGTCLLGTASVPQCHGVLPFLLRPAGRSYSLFSKAWELHFGAGFFLVQKATLGSFGCALHGDLWSLLSKAWELHFGAGFFSVQKATLGTGTCLLGTASVPQCHGVLLFRMRPAWRLLELVFEGLGAAFWSWLLLGSEGNVRHWNLLAAHRFRPSVPWRFAVSDAPCMETFGACFRRLGSCILELVSSRFRRQRQALEPACWVPLPSLGAMVCCCFGCALQGNLWSLFSKAWELHFGAGFFSVQKATLGTGTCLLGTASVPQCHSVLLFRMRPAWKLLELVFEGLGATFWSWFLLGSEGNVRHWNLCLLGTASVPQCHGVLLFRMRRAGRLLELVFEGLGAAFWSWFLFGLEGNVRHWNLLAGDRLRR
eukprot:s2193_g6.t1